MQYVAVSYRLTTVEQSSSEALDFDDGGGCGGVDVVLECAAAEFVTVNVEQRELAAKQFRGSRQTMVLHVNCFEFVFGRSDARNGGIAGFDGI